MRRTVTACVGAAVLTSLLSAPANASPDFAVPHPDAAGITALAPKGRACEQQIEKQPREKRIPWAQHEFKVEKIWPISTGSGITIAVIDSGVHVDHEQLKGAEITDGADFLHGNGGQDGRLDCIGHGTAVASLIAGQKVRGLGFRGLAHGARLLPVTVSEDIGGEETDPAKATSPEKFAKAIDWAVQQKAQVINLSVVMYEDHPAVKRAIENAVANNVVLVAAAGNQGDTEKDEPGPEPYPATYDGVIGVGAVGPTMGLWQKSQWGPQVDLVAPGVRLLAANVSGGHIFVEGTSFATAFVSASAALVRAKWPNLDAKAVADRLFATASPASGSRTKVGHGVVDPYRALTEELSAEEPAGPAAAETPSPHPAVVAREREWSLKGAIALSVAGVGVVLAAVMLATLTLLPLGKRRRWRPGRAKPIPEPEEDDMPPAPAKLFDKLETP